jgi:hypothetical protein
MMPRRKAVTPAAAALQRLEVTPLEYASEVLRDQFETLALGEEGKIENRPDWQDAILTGRSEIAEGRGVPDEEVCTFDVTHL